MTPGQNYRRLLLLPLLFLYACANIVAPQGGQKDVTPPQVIHYEPANGTLEFKESEIQIVFDEYIQTADLFNQVVISPPMTVLPEFKVKGKRLIIKFLEDLRDSTTYTINFGSAIKDITESNALDNFTYVFSTGNQLDSLRVGGSLVNILTGKPEKNAVAVLYPAFVDSTFRYSKPWYFAKADAQGNFLIQNIKSGTYYLYGLTDQNFNYFYDLPNELIAFTDSAVIPDTLPHHYRLQLFSEFKIPQQLLEARSLTYASSRLVFSESVDSTAIQYSPNLIRQVNHTGDTLLFWSTDTLVKQHDFQIHYDSTDTVLHVQLKDYSPETAALKNTITTNYFTVSKSANSPENPYLFDFSTPLEIITSLPVLRIAPELIQIFEDSLTNPIAAGFEPDTLSKNKIKTVVNFSPNKRYRLEIRAGAVTDIFNSQNDSLTFYFKTRSAEDYGKLKIILQTGDSSPVILELLKDANSVVRKEYILTPSGYEVSLPFLLPGTYLLRIRIDKNQNRTWDTGDLDALRQPEPVIFYTEPLLIRSNWDQTIEWKLSD